MSIAEKQPISVDEDDGDVQHALCAVFCELEESHVRFCIGNDRKVYLLGIYRDSLDESISGTEMVAWLKSTYLGPITAVEVAFTAEGFWERMIEQGLVSEWTTERFQDQPVQPIPQGRATYSARRP